MTITTENGIALTGKGRIKMPDREKVKIGLQCIIDGSVRCESCGYAIDNHGNPSCQQNCASDALVLLKEQEAVKPVKQIEENEWTVCGHCHKHIISNWIACPYCGKAVKWE